MVIENVDISDRDTTYRLRVRSVSVRAGVDGVSVVCPELWILYSDIFWVSSVIPAVLVQSNVIIGVTHENAFDQNILGTENVYPVTISLRRE